VANHALLLDFSSLLDIALPPSLYTCYGFDVSCLEIMGYCYFNEISRVQMKREKDDDV